MKPLFSLVLPKTALALVLSASLLPFAWGQPAPDPLSAESLLPLLQEALSNNSRLTPLPEERWKQAAQDLAQRFATPQGQNYWLNPISLGRGIQQAFKLHILQELGTTQEQYEAMDLQQRVNFYEAIVQSSDLPQIKLMLVLFDSDNKWDDVASHLAAHLPPPPDYREPGLPNDRESWRTPEFQANWGLESIGADAAYAQGITGEGVKLGIFDTGTEKGHPEFAGSNHLVPLIVSGTDDDGKPFRSDGGVPELALFDGYVSHGTGMGSIIAGQRDGVGMHGVALGATLYAAGDLEAAAGDSAMTRAIFRRLINAKVSAINHSWALDPDYPTGAIIDPTDDMHAITFTDVEDQYLAPESNVTTAIAMLQKVADAGIVNILSAGNESGIDDQGNMQRSVPTVLASQPHWRPELEPFTLSVVNVDRAGNLGESSQKAAHTRWWAVAAPGEKIYSAEINNAQAPVEIEAYEARPGSSDARAIQQRFGLTDKEYRQTRNMVLERLYPDEEAQYHYQAGGYSPDTADKIEAKILAVYRREGFDNTYDEATGSSPAAAHVTGAFGLIKQRFSALDNDQIAEILWGTSSNLTGDNPHVSEDDGAGLISIERALKGPGELRRDMVLQRPVDADRTALAWDNPLSDVVSRTQRRQGDAAAQAAWEQLKRQKGWEHGLSTRASNADQRRYAAEVAREQARQARAGRDYAAGVYMTGPVDLTLTADNRHHGDTVAAGGARISINGTHAHSRAIAEAGGTIGGTGGTHGLTVKMGGTLSPGQSIGTFHVDDAGIKLERGSLTHIEMNDQGQSDRIETTGHAQVEDGALLWLSAEHANTPLSPQQLRERLGQSATFLDAVEGVEGRFDEHALPQYAFIGTQLSYGERQASVALDRNGRHFADAGITPNQRAIGTAAERLGEGQPVFEALLISDSDTQAQALETQLSGEIHAVAAGQALNDSRRVRDTLLGQSRNRTVTSSDWWIQGLSGAGRRNATDGTTGLKRDIGGVMLGGDKPLNDTWRLGAAWGHVSNSTRAGEQGSASLKGYHLGLYGQGQYGDTALHLGGSVGQSDVETRRHVALADGNPQALESSGDARQIQAFGEVGHRLQWGQASLEPFAGLSYTHIEFKPLTESGGSAALESSRQSDNHVESTFGARAETTIEIGKATTLSPHLTLGWQHRFGGITPRRDLRFAAADDASTVMIHGAPGNRDSLLTEAGLDLRVGERTRLGVSYRGEVGKHERDHGFMASVAVEF